jgi:hypothetical protein
MSFLDSLFSGVRAFVKEFVTVAAEAVRVVLEEIDRSSFGRAATDLIRGVSKRYLHDAGDLAAEERELAEKYRRDGRRTESDRERLREIDLAREKLKKEMESEKVREAKHEFSEAQSEVIAAPLSDDEASAVVGIISSKECPKCGGTMRIKQWGFRGEERARRFEWLCTSGRGCPRIKIDLKTEQASVMRKRDPNLDLPLHERRAIWTQKETMIETATRLRHGLGEDDGKVTCPIHLLPMRLLPKPNADGLLLSTYEYVCLGVDSEGRACAQKIPLETFPQVSEALRRREGVGIIKD